jgi:hypothetical protein
MEKELILKDEGGIPSFDLHLSVTKEFVDVRQGNELQVWTLDQLIEAGAWAERIKSEGEA